MVPDTDCSVLRHLKGSEVLLRLLCSCIVWDFKSTAQTEQSSYITLSTLGLIAE